MWGHFESQCSCQDVPAAAVWVLSLQNTLICGLGIIRSSSEISPTQVSVMQPMNHGKGHCSGTVQGHPANLQPNNQPNDTNQEADTTSGLNL